MNDKPCSPLFRSTASLYPSAIISSSTPLLTSNLLSCATETCLYNAKYWTKITAYCPGQQRRLRLCLGDALLAHRQTEHLRSWSEHSHTRDYAPCHAKSSINPCAKLVFSLVPTMLRELTSKLTLSVLISAEVYAILVMLIITPLAAKTFSIMRLAKRKCPR